MHKIVIDHPPIKAARQAYEEAERNIEAFRAKVAAAREKYRADVQAALDRGDVYVDAEVVPDDAVRVHLESRLRAAEAARDGAWAGTAGELVPALEQREQELLAKALKVTPPALTPIVDELTELRSSKSTLLHRHKRMLRGGSFDTQRTAPTFAPVTDVPITAGAVVEAALTGGSFVGQSAHPALEHAG